MSNNTLRTKISSTIGGGGGGGGGGDQPESPLLYELARQIRFNGPMTVHDYMKTALTHPQHGFYMKSDVFGSSGHFTTSPEVSQLFGEVQFVLHCFFNDPLIMIHFLSYFNVVDGNMDPTRMASG